MLRYAMYEGTIARLLPLVVQMLRKTLFCGVTGTEAYLSIRRAGVEVGGGQTAKDALLQCESGLGAPVKTKVTS